MEQYIHCDLLKYMCCRCYRIKVLVTIKKIHCNKTPSKPAPLGSSPGYQEWTILNIFI